MQRTTVRELNHVTTVFPHQRSAGVFGRDSAFSLSYRIGRLGPVSVFDLSFGVDSWIECADQRPYYQVNVPVGGRLDISHGKSALTLVPGRGAVVLPEGALTVPRWEAGARSLALRIDRRALEDTLGDAIGRQVTTQIAFKHAVSTTSGPSRSWMQLLLMLNRELGAPGSALDHPLVAAPMADALLRSLLLAIDHPYRGVLTADGRDPAPRMVRDAVAVIEEHPELPLTVSSLAARTGVGVRALQKGFQRHFGTSPMAYVRQVRLRRAHQQLLESDPSIETVSSIALRWGFTNPGRFAAQHAARYGESPSISLHRRAHRYP